MHTSQKGIFVAVVTKRKGQHRMTQQHHLPADVDEVKRTLRNCLKSRTVRLIHSIGIDDLVIRTLILDKKLKHRACHSYIHKYMQKHTETPEHDLLVDHMHTAHNASTNIHLVVATKKHRVLQIKKSYQDFNHSSLTVEPEYLNLSRLLASHLINQKKQACFSLEIPQMNHLRLVFKNGLFSIQEQNKKKNAESIKASHWHTGKKSDTHLEQGPSIWSSLPEIKCEESGHALALALRGCL